jgi:hypothetical protein
VFALVRVVVRSGIEPSAFGKVMTTCYTDRVHVRLVSGQSTADYAARAENLAHGFGVPDLSMIVHGRLWTHLAVFRPRLLSVYDFGHRDSNTSSMLAQLVTVGLIS